MNRARTWIYLVVLPALVAGWGPSLAAQSPMVPGISPAHLPQNMPPGYHQAADPYSVMMGQEFYDPTMMGWYQNHGDTCCGPRWYDFHVESVWLTRENAGSNINTTSNGIAGNSPPNIVLGTDDFDFNYEPGIRASARYQVSAVHSLEIGYLGAIDWVESASATSNNDSLFSAFSQFGNSPLGGFQDVDQASLHRITTSSHLDSVELHVRRDWTSATHGWHGSWTLGPRWIRLHEDFQFFSQVDPHFDPVNNVNRGFEQFGYEAGTKNDLIGAQIGTEVGRCLLPGFLAIGQVKAGLYGNHARQNTQIAGTSIPSPLAEADADTELAFATEAAAFVTYQVHPMVRLRGGYSILYLEGVALAAENFNTQSPFSANTPRTVAIENSGEAIFHGGSIGVELGW